ncbi:MAG TPA: T9SS type A sorting domain-containing protein [Ignavibacteria bacterium]|nr:T9SS type A sorting domain-containing protein [Ignavibacteria bacterium]
MIVNRRCSPYINDDNENNRGGKRLIKIKFDANSNEFNGYNDWVITDLETGNKVLTFDKRYSTLLNLGDYQPAQGRLYKISPLAIEGGTLVSDETLSGNIMCKGKINNNGFNITLDQGTTITFSDSAGIEMNGGTFTCGVNADNADAVTLQKTSGSSGWCGLSLNNCTNIGIYNTFINGVKANDTAKSVSLTNCYNANFRRNSFTQSNNSGAIQVVFTNPSDETLTLNIRECNFNMGQSGYSGISVISNASMTTPVIIEWCNFTTLNDTSNAIMLTNVTGGAIKNSNLIGFKKSIVALGSAIDVYGNRIIGCNSSYGIQCLSGSDLKLKTVSGYYLGGENYIRNYGTSSSCIYSDNSLFDINNGENHFDLNDTVDSKFLTGTLGGVPSDNVDAAKNCFHLDSINNIEANHTMTWYGTSDPVSFTFIAYNCELTQPQDFMVFNYGGYNDTVYYNPGGEGSGFNPDKVTNMQEGSYKSLRDTINLNLRKRNYTVVEDKAKQLLTQYPDSLESIGMVQKLYIASLTLDQNGNKIGQLKTYLENLISSNSQNPGLTKRAFYHIQKCKVKLGQYQSALDGFQYIMTQNPYSYEGLVASWDYAATYLLMGQGGSLSGDTEEMTEELNTPADTLLNRMSRNDSKTKTGSDGQKTKIFYEKVKTAAKDDRTKQEEKVKQLEKTIETSNSDATKTQAKTELATMKTIKESVKIRKPNSVRTHIAIVNSDIKKIFGIGKSTSSNTKSNLIPTTFELHQNYPNPFNPSTKIAFDLPKDAKVKLVIYDILGREIKTLIHNEFRAAGKYITEFNGSNLASGVYFYRLQAGDFVSVKKMVLIK